MKYRSIPSVKRAGRIVLLLLAAVGLSACADAGPEVLEQFGVVSPSTNNTTSGAKDVLANEDVTGAEPINDAPAGDAPVSEDVQSPQNQPGSNQPGAGQPVVEQPQPVADPDFPFTGTITMDEYDWFIADSSYLGVIDVTLSPLSKRRLLDGSQPRRHASGSYVYRQPCGSRVHRIIRVDADLSSGTQITPCSSEVSNPGASDTNFGFSALSPDGRYIAVEALYYFDFEFRVSTIVFATADRSFLQVWENVASPMWLRNGRLLLSSGEGFYTGGVEQGDLQRVPDGLTGSVANPSLHPTEDVIAFEYNQQIWLMNTDGSNAREAIYSGSRLRYPAWSPDGSSVVYLSLPVSDYYEPVLYFTNLETRTSYDLSLESVLLPRRSSLTINGPLSWRP